MQSLPRVFSVVILFTAGRKELNIRSFDGSPTPYCVALSLSLSPPSSSSVSSFARITTGLWDFLIGVSSLCSPLAKNSRAPLPSSLCRSRHRTCEALSGWGQGTEWQGRAGDWTTEGEGGEGRESAVRSPTGGRGRGWPRDSGLGMASATSEPGCCSCYHLNLKRAGSQGLLDCLSNESG